MEEAMEREHNSLIKELAQGRELAKQLKNYLSPSSPLETRQFLIEKVLSSIEKALSMLNCNAFEGEAKPNTRALGGPHSLANSSPRSEVSDQDCKYQCEKDVYKKRKTQPRWTEQVKVCSGAGLEGPLDDGHSWRKYGQKEILGANFPRGYYRCTHRHSQGCLATKQVQRSDEDSTILQVTYRGRHTCVQASRVALPSTWPMKDLSKQTTANFQLQQHEGKVNPSEEVLFNFGEGLKVKTEELDNREDIFQSFSFPFTSIGNENEDCNFLGDLSPAFLSPTTSDSNIFSVLPCNMTTFGIGHNVQTSESGLSEIISAPPSVTNSPIGDLDIAIDNVDFDSLEFY